MGYDTFTKKYEQLMSGKTVSFSETRVIDILTHLDYYKINTLMVQSDPEKTSNIAQWFICRVDEPTVRAYLKEKKKEMNPLG